MWIWYTCPTNKGRGGVTDLNAALHRRYRQSCQPVSCYSAEFGVVGATTLARVPLKVGDLVMYTENDYELGLRNGSLGTIIEALVVGSSEEPCCVCDFEGITYLLNTRQINALAHAYAISVHKSQGSQFKRVIIPIRDSHFLDQTLVYTAVTRGVSCQPDWKTWLLNPYSVQRSQSIRRKNAISSDLKRPAIPNPM